MADNGHFIDDCWMYSQLYDAEMQFRHSQTTCRQVSNIRRTTTQHLKDSPTVLQLSLQNPLKPNVKSRMKM